MFQEKIGSALRPYRKHKEKARFAQPTAGRRGRAYVIGSLRKGGHIDGHVGNLDGPTKRSLPRNMRFANKGTSPTTEPAGSNEPKSKHYVAAARRTRQKYRRR